MTVEIARLIGHSCLLALFCVSDYLPVMPNFINSNYWVDFLENLHTSINRGVSLEWSAKG